MVLTVLQKVIAVVMTSSLGPIPNAFKDKNKADVHDDNAEALIVFLYCANAASNFLVFGPVPVHELVMHSTTASFSRVV